MAEAQTQLYDTTIFPAYSTKYVPILNRINRELLVELVLHWLANPITEPHLNWTDYTFEEGSDDEEQADPREAGLRFLKKEYSELIGMGTTKKEVVLRILEDHWSGGLNMKQVADIDILCE